MGDDRAEGLSATRDGRQAAISFTPDNDTGSGSLLDSILFTFIKEKKKTPSDVWVVALFFSLQMTW